MANSGNDGALESFLDEWVTLVSGCTPENEFCDNAEGLAIVARDLTEVEQKGEMSRNVCGPLVDKGGFGFVPPAKSGPIASAARRTESRVGLGPPGTACHCTLREAHRAFGIGHSVRRKPSEGRAISPCSSGSLPRKGRTQRGTTNDRRVGMGRTAWLKALYYDMPLGPSGSC